MQQPNFSSPGNESFMAEDEDEMDLSDLALLDPEWERTFLSDCDRRVLLQPSVHPAYPEGRDLDTAVLVETHNELKGLVHYLEETAW
jgi:hypothetical protein